MMSRTAQGTMAVDELAGPCLARGEMYLSQWINVREDRSRTGAVHFGSGTIAPPQHFSSSGNGAAN
jgi:hypothetical protein